MFYSCISYWVSLYDVIYKLKTDYGIPAIGILHDKDAGKKNHNHVIISVDSDDLKSVKNLLENVGDGNVLVQYCRDIQYALDYLTHCKSRGKHKYENSELISLDFAYWQDVYTIGNNKDDDFVDDLVADDFNPLILARKYGRDFIKNFHNYVEFRLYVRGEIKND